jgi:hypothetical protein
MVADVRAGRIGIQKYRGVEVNKPDLDLVRVYRPETEVFNKETMASFTSVTVTKDHPPTLIDSTNWKKFAVGFTGETVFQGRWIRSSSVDSSKTQMQSAEVHAQSESASFPGVILAISTSLLARRRTAKFTMRCNGTFEVITWRSSEPDEPATNAELATKETGQCRTTSERWSSTESRFR